MVFMKFVFKKKKAEDKKPPELPSMQIVNLKRNQK